MTTRSSGQWHWTTAEKATRMPERGRDTYFCKWWVLRNALQCVIGPHIVIGMCDCASQQQKKFHNCSQSNATLLPYLHITMTYIAVDSGPVRFPRNTLDLRLDEFFKTEMTIAAEKCSGEKLERRETRRLFSNWCHTTALWNHLCTIRTLVGPHF